MFAVSIAIDTIGHRTIYKEVLRGGEQLVHHITILCGVASVVLLVLAYDNSGLAIPAMVKKMYVGIDPRLIGAAGRSVLAHLIDLRARG